MAMSVQAMSWVFEHSEASGTDRLVLLALANHAGQATVGDAWESWPGVERIAREAAVTFRTAQESLSRLERDGHIVRVIHGSPDERVRADRRTNLYRILLHEEPAPAPLDDVDDEPEEGHLHSPQEAWQRVDDEVRSDDTPSANTPQSVPDSDPDSERGAVQQHPVESSRDAVSPQVVEGDGVLSGDATGCGVAQNGVRSDAERGAAWGRNGVRRDNTLTITKPSGEPSERTITGTSSSSMREAHAAKPEPAAAAAADVEMCIEAWEAEIGSRAGKALRWHIEEAVGKYGEDAVIRAIVEAARHDSKRWAYVEKVAARLAKEPADEPPADIPHPEVVPAQSRHHALWERARIALQQTFSAALLGQVAELQLVGYQPGLESDPVLVFEHWRGAELVYLRQSLRMALMHVAPGECWDVFIQAPVQAVAQ